MYHVYVLKSLRSKKRYVGSTSIDPLQRLQQHNNGRNQFTKGHAPFSLILTEDYETKTEAIKREHFLKSGQGRKLLDEILSERLIESL